jgi:hypothetical protein
MGSDEAELAAVSGASVRRRTVFYIPGFGPVPPRRYRELYRSEGAAQAAISGYDLVLSSGGGPGTFGWQVAAQIDGPEVNTKFEVLVWSDIVRQSMSGSIQSTYWQLCRTAWTYIATGALWRLMRLRKGPVIAALYPVAMLLGQAVLAVAVALGISVSLARAAPDGVLISGMAWAIGLAAGLGILRWCKSHDGRVFAYYLMHDYAFTAQLGGANPPELDRRLAEFGERVAKALTENVDEVLVVGHSSGAHLAVQMLANLHRRRRMPANGPALGLLTLGQVVPMVSFLPKAFALRRDLRDLSEAPGVTWVDVTAPGDGCSFALCDPVAVSGVAGPGKRWPLVISAAFTQTLSPARWRALRWRFFRLHFQYLCAFDRPGDYDYFRITAGPLTLSQRFHGRAPSASRIERPVNGHVSMGLE